MSKEVTIAGALFTIATPYLAGYVLNEIEAGVLNQTRAENVRNNTAKNVKVHLEAGDAAAATESVKAYDDAYEFTSRREGGSSKRDPLESAALVVAKEVIRDKLKDVGKKIGTEEGMVSKEKFLEMSENFAATEGVIKIARARLAAKAKLFDATEIEL